MANMLTTGPMGPAGPAGGGYRPYVPASGAYGQSDPFTQQMGSYWNALQGQAAGANSAIDSQIRNYGMQQGLLAANQQTQTGYLNQDKASQLARIGLGREGLGIQQGALQRAMGILPQTHQLTEEGFNQNEAEARTRSDQQNRALSSQMTQQGSTVSAGNRQGISDIATQLMYSMGNIGRARRGEDISFKEQQAQQADQQKQLALTAKGFDLDTNDVNNRLQRALSQMGLDTALKTSDLAQAINDANAGRPNPLQSLLGAVYQMSGLRPTVG